MSWSSSAGRGDDGMRAFILLEGAVVDEVDLVIGIIFISCNGSVVVGFILYSTC